MPQGFRRPCDRAPPARRFASKPAPTSVFGPVMSVPLPGPPCWFGWGLGQGLHVHALVFSAPSRPCAARAALREQARSYICFGPVMSEGLPGPPCWFALGLGQGRQVHGSRFLAPLRPCAARAALPELRPVPHLFRASYVCGITWTALFVWLEIGSGPPCACLGFFGALETVRRPRGASRASPLLHLFSGQLCLCHCLVRLVCLVWDWVRASMCMPRFFPAPSGPRAARAALPGQARSHICFGPVIPVPLPGPLKAANASVAHSTSCPENSPR